MLRIGAGNVWKVCCGLLFFGLGMSGEDDGCVGAAHPPAKDEGKGPAGIGANQGTAQPTAGKHKNLPMRWPCVST